MAGLLLAIESGSESADRSRRGTSGGRRSGGGTASRAAGRRGATVVHVDDDRLTILGAGLTTRGRLVSLLRTEGHDLAVGLIGAEADEVIADGLGATIGETEVIFFGAESIGVTGDDHLGALDAGGDGIDRLIFTGATSGVLVDLAAGTATGMTMSSPR